MTLPGRSSMARLESAVAVHSNGLGCWLGVSTNRLAWVKVPRGYLSQLHTLRVGAGYVRSLRVNRIGGPASA